MKWLLFAISLVFMTWLLVERLSAPAPAISSAPTVEQLKPLAALLTHRVVVTDALTVNLDGRTGGLRAAVIIRGDAALTIDLTEARMENVDHAMRTVTVILPPPSVMAARVDHAHSHIFSIESKGLWVLVPTDDGRAELLDRAMKQAQSVVYLAAGEPTIIEQARTRAAALVYSFLIESFGWTVEVRWSDRFQDDSASLVPGNPISTITACSAPVAIVRPGLGGLFLGISLA